MNDKTIMQKAADNIRVLAVSMVEKANSGHPGGAMGGADFINVLFSEYLVYDPDEPTWFGQTVSFLIRDTCRLCSTRLSVSQGSLPLMS